MTILDGKSLAEKIKAKAAEEVAALQQYGGVGFGVMLIGSDPASQIYVSSKKKNSEATGIRFTEYILPDTATERECLDIIETMNNDKNTHGILIQMPLPKGSSINPVTLQNAILPEKDVDGFHLVNMGRIMSGDYGFISCTPYGIMELLKAYNIEISGKHCVVIGRSLLVGKPMAMLMQKENATVTMCHSRTVDLAQYTRNADIVVAAVGVPKLLTGDMIKEGSVIIDVGINRTEGSKKIIGDVDFDSCSQKAAYITPVPGGVGPMTIAMLMKNTVTAAKRHYGVNL